MLERLKKHRLYVLGQFDFYGFPIVPVMTGEIPSWHLLIDILFVVAYLGVFNHQEPAPILAILGSHADLCSWEYCFCCC